MGGGDDIFFLSKCRPSDRWEPAPPVRVTESKLLPSTMEPIEPKFSWSFRDLWPF